MTNDELYSASMDAAHQVVQTLIAESIVRRCVQYAHYTKFLWWVLWGKARPTIVESDGLTIYEFVGKRDESEWSITLERRPEPEGHTPERPTRVRPALRVVQDPQP